MTRTRGEEGTAESGSREGSGAGVRDRCDEDNHADSGGPQRSAALAAPSSPNRSGPGGRKPSDKESDDNGNGERLLCVSVTSPLCSGLNAV